jgi:hypothetical protein
MWDDDYRYGLQEINMVKKFFVISAIVILMAAVVIFGVMFFNTRANLVETQTALNGKISELTEVKAELVNTQGELAETTSDLTEITSELANTASELADTRDQLNEKTVALTTAEKELDNTKDRLDTATTELTAEKKENTTLLASNTRLNTDLADSQNEVETLTRSIALYQETFGEVFSGVEPYYRVNDSMPPAWNATGPFKESYRGYNLINNPDAVNPTYQEVLNFIWMDTTDSYRYILNYYMCGNFAETVHNNAEAAGIRTATVFIRFEHGVGHAINAFLTTDRGLVYIDSTGASFQTWANLDCIVNGMKISQIYMPVFLFPSSYINVYDLDNPITDIEVYW